MSGIFAWYSFLILKDVGELLCYLYTFVERPAHFYDAGWHEYVIT